MREVYIYDGEVHTFRSQESLTVAQMAERIKPFMTTPLASRPPLVTNAAVRREIAVILKSGV